MAEWLQKTLAAHASSAKPVGSCAFPRLPNYFTVTTLQTSKIVLVDQLPRPPLSSWGLTRFADFERGDFTGITFQDTFFIRRDQSKNEAIHFHELIHVVQCRILGPERFLYLYADGLERDLWRGEFAADTFRPCARLQSNTPAPGITKRCAIAASCPTRRQHCRYARSRRAASSICPDMIFGKDRL
jgi:hypothetical protein